jgi:hypothetical protein
MFRRLSLAALVFAGLLASRVTTVPGIESWRVARA